MFVVETQTGGERKSAPEVEARLVVKGEGGGGDFVVGRKGTVLDDVLRLDGVVHPLPHPERTDHPLVAPRVVGLERQFLTQHLLPEGVDDVIEVGRSEVLVDGLAVVDILEGGLAVERKRFVLIACAEARRRDGAAVGRRSVVVHLRCPSAGRVVGRIGIAPLVGVVEEGVEAQRPPGRRFPHQSQPSETLVEGIGFAVERYIAETAAVVVVAPREGKTEVGRKAGVVGQLHAAVGLSAGAQLQARALIGERREGVNVDGTPDGIATKESTLRSTKHLDAPHLGQVEVEGGVFKVGHAVHVERHRRAFGLGADAADVDGGVLLRPIVGHVEVGEHGGEFLDVAHLLVAQEVATQHRHRRWSEVALVEFELHDLGFFKVHIVSGRIDRRVMCRRESREAKQGIKHRVFCYVCLMRFRRCKGTAFAGFS